MALTVYGDISQRTAAWAAVTMLSHAEPILVLSKFGQNRPLPKNKANTVKFRRPRPFAISTTALTEGVTPKAQKMVYEDVTVAIAQYGEVTEITDVVHDLSEDPVLRDASILSGEQAAETVEMITWGVVKAGTTVMYSNGTTRAGVNTVISLNMIRSGVRTLKRNRGRQHTAMLASSPNYNTAGIEGGYLFFGHTDLESDIRQIPGFTPVADYGSRKPLCPEECGSVENVRIILTPLLDPFLSAGGTPTGVLSTDAASADVYPFLITAKEAYGLVPLKGEGAITPSVLNPGTPSKSDPLGQRGYVGWKTYYACVRLNETWMVRGECAATDL